jgi:DNA repair exonuclease SbcCD ATPase subunit
MKWIALVFLCVTGLLIFVRLPQTSLWSLGIGIAVGCGLIATLFAFQTKTSPPSSDTAQWQHRLKEQETQSAHLIDQLNREIQKLQQKLVRTEDRCSSYQKLVDVHQAEIDKTRQERTHLSELVIQKDKKLAELQLARLEPDLFDTDKRQKESSFRELKKQFEEKSTVLDQTRARLFRIENELLALQKEKEEGAREISASEMTLIGQMKQMEDENKKMETELVSLQQLISELSSKHVIT